MSPALNILIAEDNRINARVAEGILARRGHRVTVVPDGQAAVDAVAAGEWDVVLMDLQMPRLSGLEATREIRRLEQGTPGHLPIIALTANALGHDRRRCLEAGMDGYVAKPVQAEVLLGEIREVLARLGPSVNPAERRRSRRTAG
jgi:CheY-like chemotaxis protein